MLTPQTRRPQPTATRPLQVVMPGQRRIMIGAVRRRTVTHQPQLAGPASQLGTNPPILPAVRRTTTHTGNLRQAAQTPHADLPARNDIDGTAATTGPTDAPVRSAGRNGYPWTPTADGSLTATADADRLDGSRSRRQLAGRRGGWPRWKAPPSRFPSVEEMTPTGIIPRDYLCPSARPTRAWACGRPTLGVRVAGWPAEFRRSPNCDTISDGAR